MVLGTMFDLNVLSYLVLVITKEQGVIVGRGGVCPRPSSKAKPILSRRARRDLPSNIGRGRASPRGSGEAEPALSRRARQNLPSDVERGGAYPRTMGEMEPALGGRVRRSLALEGRARRNQSSVVQTRNAVAFSSDRKCQRSMVISSTSLGTPILSLRQLATC